MYRNPEHPFLCKNILDVDNMRTQLIQNKIIPRTPSYILTIRVISNSSINQETNIPTPRDGFGAFTVTRPLLELNHL